MVGVCVSEHAVARPGSRVYSLGRLEGKTGRIECWDLHVGAKLEVLGRKVTLMKARARRAT